MSFLLKYIHLIALLEHIWQHVGREDTWRGRWGGSTVEAGRGQFTTSCCSTQDVPLLPVALCPTLSPVTLRSSCLLLEKKGPGPFIFAPTTLRPHPLQQSQAQALLVRG